MAGALAFAVPFAVSLFFTVPGLFDTTMMSRLAIFPMIGSAVLFMGRRNVRMTHLIVGISLAVLPAVSLIWSASPVGGIPFAVRWFSFGLMIIGFSGSVYERGFRPYMNGLVAAAALTAVTMLAFGPDSLTGNPNRAGMVLALGFTASIAGIEGRSRFRWLLPPLILAGMIRSSFLIGWAACLLGSAAFFGEKWKRFDVRWLLVAMIAGQAAFSLLPAAAGRIGPTLELRSRIWRCSAVLFMDELPLGTGTGSARLEIFNSAEPELRILAGGDRRVDYLHSEPLALAVESGIPGLLVMGFLLYWLFRKVGGAPHAALLAAFWPIFASDLPLATPLGALPAALFLGSYPPLDPRRVSLPAVIPLLTGAASLWWGFTVLTGYGAMGSAGHPSTEELEAACSRIPWEERAFLAAGYSHLGEGSILAALDDSRRFLELYPSYYRGWELRAAALSAAGRNAHSSWAKAVLLIPENICTPQKYLMAMNGIDPGGMSPDSACMLAEVLTYSREGTAEAIGMMSPEELAMGAGKLLELSSLCRERSDSLSARAWFIGLAFAAQSRDELPAETAIGIFRSMDLYDYLPWDWGPKADEYLLQLGESTGMEPVPAPSP